MSKEALSKEDKKLVMELFKSSFMLEGCYNYERQQALGYAIAIWPAIKTFYHTKEEQAKALVRHMEIFNTTPHVLTAITGVNAALEKEASTNPDFDTTSINSIKVGLMGPFAGIGDSFFWGTLRIIAVAIGISLAKQGSAFGFILFLLLFNIPHVIIKYYLTVAGYKFGTGLMGNAKESGILQTISKGATIVGLMVVGGMSASMVNLSTPLEITLGETPFAIQGYLDQIFPLLLPFLYVLGMFGLLKKGVSATWVLLITIAVGIVGALIGIF